MSLDIRPLRLPYSFSKVGQLLCGALLAVFCIERKLADEFSFFHLAFAVAALQLLGKGITPILSWRGLCYEITSDEVRISSGWPSAMTRLVPLHCIQEVQVRHEYYDRPWGTGTVRLLTAAVPGGIFPSQHLVAVSEPEIVADQIRKLAGLTTP